MDSSHILESPLEHRIEDLDEYISVIRGNNRLFSGVALGLFLLGVIITALCAKYPAFADMSGGMKLGPTMVGTGVSALPTMMFIINRERIVYFKSLKRRCERCTENEAETLVAEVDNALRQAQE